MSKSKRQIKTKAIVKMKKTWHPIIAPTLFNRQLLGQSLVAEDGELLNKTIAANAMNVTDDMKKQHITITFKVTSTKNGQGLTSVCGYEINPAYIKRMVKRKRNKLDLSFSAVTRDNEAIRIKPSIFTKSEASGSICAALRRKTQDCLIRYAKTVSFEDFVRDLLMNKLQNTIRAEVKKIYPIKTAEIRWLGFEQEVKAPVEAPEAPVVEEKAPEKPARAKRKAKEPKVDAEEKKEEKAAAVAEE